jgi:putative acetyltransferase
VLKLHQISKLGFLSRGERPFSPTGEQAFGQINEALLIEKIRESDPYIPELSLVAKIDEVSIGQILSNYIDLVGEETFRVLGLAPMAVLPKFQNQGVGSQLITAG